MTSAPKPVLAPTSGDGATIAEIAALARVSVATVSKVVNGRSEVAPETRALVEGIIRKHGYRRQKKVNRAALIELVLHEFEGAYAMEMIKGAGQVARDHGLALVVSELQGRHTPGRSWIEGVLARRPTGVVSVFSGPTPTQQEQLRSRNIPYVLVDPTDEPGEGHASVGTSNWDGGVSATRHLLNLGHRRIAVITGPSDMLSSRARLDGYRTALDTAGVPVDLSLIREGDFHVEDGRVHARALLGLPDPPSAVFACNDAQALGVYQAAREAGLRIPEDLSVVGFDDLPSAGWALPALTTIRQPLCDMAAAATSMVVDLAGGSTPAQLRQVLSTELIARASTAPPGR